MAGYDISGLFLGEKPICAPLCHTCASSASRIIANTIGNVNTAIGERVQSTFSEIASRPLVSPPSARADEGPKMSRLFSVKAGPFWLAMTGFSHSVRSSATCGALVIAGCGAEQARLLQAKGGCLGEADSSSP